MQQLYAYDPTPKSIDFVESLRMQDKIDDRFVFQDIALIADKEQTEMKMYLPKNSNHVSGSSKQVDHLGGNAITVKALDLQRMMEQNGHTHIDLLKVDVEGAEFEVFEGLLADYMPFCNQVLVEQHERFGGTKGTIALIQWFMNNDFKLLHVEKGQEFTFIRDTSSNQQE